MTSAVVDEPAPPAIAPAAPEPPRVRMARVASAAARSVSGVVRLDAGPTAAVQTAVGGTSGERVEGVRSAAGPDGYDVTVQLVAALVPLHALTDEVRATVRAAVAEAGLAADLGRIDVAVSGVEELG